MQLLVPTEEAPTMNEPVTHTESQPEAWSPDAIERMLRALGEEMDDALESGARACGPFTLLEVLGQGGFGTVYAAVQESPVKRRVALKVMREGMATEDVLRRFSLEQRALARIDHPCVASILEAGTTAEGTPWFAMPLIDGDPITRACADAGAGPRTRAALMASVCDGVHAAHVQGIIHRDLKPANILVVDQGGGPGTTRLAPKVIDFGIAKAIDPDTAEELGVTRTAHGRAAGTLAYMAPEQVSQPTPSADVRTDVFALGVVLCELLSGEKPAASGPLSRLGPLRPSQLPTVRTQRAGSKRRGRALLDDLDAIVARATMPEPELRYQSAEAMAADLRRALRSEPVEARPPNTLYVLGRLVRRHRGVVVATALGFATTAALAIVALTAAARARANETAATLRATQFAQVNGVLAGMFDRVEPGASGEADTALLMGMLDAAATQVLSTADTTDPTVLADVAEAIGSAYIRFDRPDAAYDLADALLQSTELRPNFGPNENDGPVETLLAKARVLNLRGQSHAAREAKKTGAGSPIGDVLPAWQDWRAAYAMLEAAGLGESDPAVVATLRLWGFRTGRNEGDWEHHAIALDGWLDEHVNQLPESSMDRWKYQLLRAQFTDFNGIFERYPPLLARFEQAFGEKHPDVIRARQQWLRHAVAAALEGQVIDGGVAAGIPHLTGTALARHWAATEDFGAMLIADATHVLGPNHSKTLSSRVWHLAVVGHGRGVEAARPLYEALCADIEALQPPKPEFLTQTRATWRGIVEGPRQSLWWREDNWAPESAAAVPDAQSRDRSGSGEESGTR